MMKRSYKQKRLEAAILLMLLLFCAANYYLDLGFLGRFGKGAYILSVGLILAYGCSFAATRREIEEHRNEKRGHPQ